MHSKILLVVTLLGLTVATPYNLKSATCTQLTSYTDCMNSVNNASDDDTKCLPITGQSIKCASELEIEANNYKVDYQTHYNTLSGVQKVSINELKVNQRWGTYPYFAQAGDKYLESYEIFTNSRYSLKALAGYYRATNQIIVSFRGSSNIPNFMNDGKHKFVDYTVDGCSGCQVETGFQDMYKSYSAQILTKLKSLVSSYPTASIVVTGHSLGAAESVLAAADYLQNGFKVNLYTYGCLRVGNENFANYFNKKITGDNLRGVFRQDPVPTSPDNALGYVHVGQEVHFYSCQDFIAYPPYTDDAPTISMMGEDQDMLSLFDHMGYLCLIPNDFSYSASSFLF